MKSKFNTPMGGGQQGRHTASNTVLLLTLLVTPLLRKPVCKDHLHVKITVEKGQTPGLASTKEVMYVDVSDELIRMGYIALLVLAGAYIRKKENNAGALDSPESGGMTMCDGEVIEAWRQVRRQLSAEDDAC